MFSASPQQPAATAPGNSPPQPTGPGDFTRMFQAPPPQSAIVPPQAAVPAAAALPAKKPSYLPLFLILGVLLLVAVAVVVIFALRK